jgi:hypothetical protein
LLRLLFRPALGLGALHLFHAVFSSLVNGIGWLHGG